MRTAHLIKSFYKHLPFVHSGRSEKELYYDGIMENENIKSCHTLYGIIGERCYYTKVPITFKGIELSGSLSQVINTFGRPGHKKQKIYGDKQFKTLMYKHQFCGLNVRTLINVLDKTVLNFRYRIDVNSKETLLQIKEVIRQKYHLCDAELGDYFTVVDEMGNKLIFNKEFDLSITYLSTDPYIRCRVNMIMNEVEAYRAQISRERMGKMEFAF